MPHPVELDEVRQHYDFSAPQVISEIRRLASCAASDLTIARHFGYTSVCGFMSALEKSPDAYIALYQERAGIEVDCLAVIGTIRDSEGHRDQLKAAIYLLERVAKMDAQQQGGNLVPITKALTPEDARARLRRVRDLQRAG